MSDLETPPSPSPQLATSSGEQPSPEQVAKAAAKAPLMKIGPFRLRRTRHGLLMFNINDVYIGGGLDLYGECNEVELQFLKQIVKPGSCVVDIGANIGVHSVFFAACAGPKGTVLSYEPQRICHQLLATNMMLNGYVNCLVNLNAMGSAPGDIYVPRIDVNRRYNFGGVSVNAEQDGERVKMITVDSVGLKTCHLIKIDVEGYEREVLRGAEATIHTTRPVLYVENDREENSPALLEKMFDMDYRLYWHTPPLFNARNFYGVEKNIFGRVVSANVVGIPKEREMNIRNLREIKSLDDFWKRPPIQPSPAKDPQPQAKEENAEG